jgi:uncharacterized protein (TIGR03382 family)
MKIRSNSRALILAASSVMALAGAANADVIMTLTYDDLGGTYAASSATSGMFNARAVSTNRLRTQGNVSRVDPDETALFDTGFLNLGSNPSNFEVNISVLKASAGATTATGGGSFVATDVDGDTITGDLEGNWIQIAPGFIAFNGTISGVRLNDNGEVLDGTFNGNAGTSMNMDLPGEAPYMGALVSLVFGRTDFFTRTFETPQATGLTAQIIPSPGAIALAGAGGLVLRRRRK